MKSDKYSCLECMHCNLELGEPDYSEYTPGSPGSFDCSKGVWSFDEGYLPNKTMAKSLDTGKNCEHWTPELWVEE